ncbi:MAG: cytochrome c biogenesis CcdA family protein [Ectobacillus sp.]
MSVLFAFTGGLLSFFSPCVFPLLPAYISYLTGSTIQDGKIQPNRLVLMQRSFGFVIGFSIIFMVMGVSASVIGQLLHRTISSRSLFY